MRNPIRLALLVLALLTLAGPLAALAHDHDGAGAKPAAPQATATAATGDPYYLSTCPVTGQPLEEGKFVTYNYKGRELRFANQEAVATFEADPQKYISDIDAKMIADQTPYYPLDTCPVTGEKLAGDMGGPVDYIYNNRLVRFCCAGCIEEFNSDPAKYLKVIDDAVKAKQSAGYPFDKCMVLTDQDFKPKRDTVIANRLFRLCCGDCQKEVRANPAEWVAKLDAAWAAKKTS